MTRYDAETVTCPTCKAYPGHQCETLKLGRPCAPHRSRVLRADATLGGRAAR